MIPPIARMVIPMVMLELGTVGSKDVRAGVGVKVFRLPAGRGVLVAGAGVGVKVGVRDGKGVIDRTPVTVGVSVNVGVMVAVGVLVTVGVRVGVGDGVGG